MRIAKVIAPVIGVLLFAGVAVPAHAAPLTSVQVQAVIALLQSFGVDAGIIANVQATLGGSSSPLSCSTFANLTYGNFDTDPGGRVSQLQTWLGISSNTFGFGTYGPRTRALWNSKCGGQTTPPVIHTAPTLSFTASTLFPTYGHSYTLNWFSTNADSCLYSNTYGESNSIATSGSDTRTNDGGTIVHTITCQGIGGSVTKSVTINKLGY